MWARKASSPTPLRPSSRSSASAAMISSSQLCGLDGNPLAARVKTIWDTLAHYSACLIASLYCAYGESSSWAFAADEVLPPDMPTIKLCRGLLSSRIKAWFSQQKIAQHRPSGGNYRLCKKEFRLARAVYGGESAVSSERYAEIA